MVAPTLEIDGVLGPGEQGALAEAFYRLRGLTIAPETIQQPVHHIGGDARALRWINIAEENEVAQEDAPVRSETIEHPRPIQTSPVRADEVGDIRTIITFTLHHKGFRPDGFFHRAELNRQAEDLGVDGVCKPNVIDFGYTVAGAENNIDEVFPRVSLGEPAWISHFRSIACRRQNVEDARTLPRSNEKVDILRMAHYPV